MRRETRINREATPPNFSVAELTDAAQPRFNAVLTLADGDIMKFCEIKNKFNWLEVMKFYSYKKAAEIEARKISEVKNGG